MHIGTLLAIVTQCLAKSCLTSCKKVSRILIPKSVMKESHDSRPYLHRHEQFTAAKTTVQDDFQNREGISLPDRRTLIVAVIEV